MFRFYILTIGLFGICTAGLTQEKGPLVTKNFKFTDGVYLSLAEWKTNEPQYTWEDLEARLATNPQTFLTQVEMIKVKATGAVIEPDSLWGLCLAGIPYIRIPKEEANKEVPTFAGLRVRGKICYYTYPTEVISKVKVTAYNPLTRTPFRSGYVDKSETITQERMLHFETGQIAPFESVAFLDWIADDQQLVESLIDLSEEEKGKKLFKCLLIYVDRNPVYLPSAG